MAQIFLPRHINEFKIAGGWGAAVLIDGKCAEGSKSCWDTVGGSSSESGHRAKDSGTVSGLVAQRLVGWGLLG